jgi:hypothetical protein
LIELNPISVSQYLELEDKSEFDFAMKFAFVFTEPIDEYKIGDIMEQPFGWVKDFQYEIEQGLSFAKLIDLVSETGKIKDIGKEPLDKFMRFANYLITSIQQIVEVENESLAYEPDPDEVEAGMDKFNGLGVYLQIRSLTGGDVTKFDQVRQLPYSLCFTEMYTAKQMSDYQKDLTRIKQNKH